MEKQSPAKLESEFGRLYTSAEDQNTPEHNLDSKKEPDKPNPKRLQDLQTVKPKEGEEKKLSLSSDEVVGIKNIISEQLYSNLISKTTSTQILFQNSTDIPLLSRINRLDIVLDYLEGTNLSGGSTTALPEMDGGKSATSEMVSDKNSLEKRCRPISCVLEEAEAKGTIMERVVLLEDRVRRIGEELERRNSCDQVIKSDGTEEQMHLHLNGSNASEIVVEDEKKEIGDIPSESSQKGLHEDVSRQILQSQDIPKDNKNDPMDENFPNQNNKEDVIMIVMEEEERVGTEHQKNQTRGKRAKEKLRRMFPGCIFLQSH